MNRPSRFAAALVLAAALAARAEALINLRYTPVDLVRQSERILKIEVGPPDESGAVPVRVAQALAGAAAPKPALTIARADAKVRDEFAEAVGEGAGAEAYLFAGDFSGAADDAALAANVPVGVLHVDLAWFGLFPAAGAGFRVGADTLAMKTVWAGDNEMLGAVVRYILDDGRADVPVQVGVQWWMDVRLGEMTCPVASLLAADFAGEGRPGLLVASPGGDRLFRPTGPGGALQDATADAGLDTTSACAAVGDYDGDGRLDLASSDGQGVVLRLANDDGTFRSAGAQANLGAEIVSLATVDVGAKAAGLVAGTKDGPVLLVQGEGGVWKAEPISVRLAAPTRPAGCVAADFDGDGHTDLVDVRPGGVRYFKGAGPGAWATEPVLSAAALAGNLAGTFASDFDGDGRLDLLVWGARGLFILAHEAEGRFRDTLAASGEVPYNSKSNVADAAPFDINNDGRTEFVACYEYIGMQPFFNRGFRTFGYGIALEAAQSELAEGEAIQAGQQAAAAADFNGDGARDLALVTRDGTIVVLFREADEGPTLGLEVALPSEQLGPVTVTATDGKRSLGARVARPGRPAFFGKVDKGPFDLAWRSADGRAHTKRIIVLKPTRIVLHEP